MADRIPGVSKELIEYLERVFPDKCPDDSLTDRQVWLAAGAAKCVRHLRTLFNNQHERALASSHVTLSSEHKHGR